MKTCKKLFVGALALAMAFVAFGCKQQAEEEKLNDVKSVDEITFAAGDWEVVTEAKSSGKVDGDEIPGLSKSYDYTETSKETIIYIVPENANDSSILIAKSGTSEGISKIAGWADATAADKAIFKAFLKQRGAEINESDGSATVSGKIEVEEWSMSISGVKTELFPENTPYVTYSDKKCQVNDDKTKYVVSYKRTSKYGEETYVSDNTITMTKK